jgi:hypothetical protein
LKTPFVAFIRSWRTGVKQFDTYYILGFLNSFTEATLKKIAADFHQRHPKIRKKISGFQPLVGNVINPTNKPKPAEAADFVFSIL